MKTFFRPWMSASLPKGTRNMAAARRYEVATQLSDTASIANSAPIEGRAMLIEEPIKGGRKAASVAATRADHFTEESSITLTFQKPTATTSQRPLRPAPIAAGRTTFDDGPAM